MLNERSKWSMHLKVQTALGAYGRRFKAAPNLVLVNEVDLVIDDARVARADVIMMTPGDEQAQRDATRSDQRPSPGYTRIFVPPTLVIESISRGHEVHDRRTKMRWYAEYGVPNYWIIDAFQKSLECFILDKGDGYRLDQSGRDTDTVQPSLFEGLILPLNQIWTA